MRIFLVIFTALLSSTAYSQSNFLWATASSAYQVEGAWQADGKGQSIWDVYTNKHQVTQAIINENQTGNLALNEYDRKQYLQDIALMKKLGINSYRFSISWTRLIPDGDGKINQAGLDHYTQFIDDLLQNGIEPMVTIYHWDFPQALAEKGGWHNPESVKWFDNYAHLIFTTYGKKVKKFITINEPYFNIFWAELAAQNIINKVSNPMAFTTESCSKEVLAAHHLMLANAKAIQTYRSLGLKGIVGVTLGLAPTLPLNDQSDADKKAAIRQDGIQNRWFLDPLFKGTYPADILRLYQQHNPSFQPSAADYTLLAANKPDFLGINYYAPSIVNEDSSMPFALNWQNNPDSIKSFNGPVRPEYLHHLLVRLKNEYGNPMMIITENGAGFGDKDDELANGSVQDNHRADYLKRHIEAAMAARKEGVNLQGYTAWSLFDNFEWFYGYTSRFGLVYINYKTQERIPKKSFLVYKDLIKKYGNK